MDGFSGMPHGDKRQQGMRLEEQINRVSARSVPRGVHFVLFFAAMIWVAGANAIAERSAQGIVVRFQIGLFEPLIEALFLLFLTVVGLTVLDKISTHGKFAADTLPLPLREGWSREWAVGAAIGWGLILAAVLPVFVSGHLHADLNWGTGSTVALIASSLGLLAAALAQEVIFRGYAFRRLIAAIGPGWASVFLSLVFAVVVVENDPPRSIGLPMVVTTLFGLLLAIAWLRTHALWLGWGLNFAYRVVAAVALGLPIAGHTFFGSPANTYAWGPRWLTGGAFGLDAALLTAFAMLGAMIVLYRATRDYAWKYTLPEIVAAGYEVTVAPPAAHLAMEKAAAPPPLVQILPSTPQTMSSVPLPVEPPPHP